MAYEKQKKVVSDFLSGTPRGVLNLNKSTVSIMDSLNSSWEKKFTMDYDLNVAYYKAPIFIRVSSQGDIKKLQKLPKNQDDLKTRRLFYLKSYFQEYFSMLRQCFLDFVLQNVHIKFFSSKRLKYSSLIIPTESFYRHTVWEIIKSAKNDVFKHVEAENNQSFNTLGSSVTFINVKDDISTRRTEFILEIYVPKNYITICSMTAVSFEYEDDSRNFVIMRSPNINLVWEICFTKQLGNVEFNIPILLPGDTVRIPGICSEVRIEKISEQFLNSLGYLGDENAHEFYVGSSLLMEVETDSNGDIKNVTFPNSEEELTQ